MGIWYADSRRSTYFETSYYTLCDGHPRVITSTPTATRTTVFEPLTTSYPMVVIGLSQLVDPNCTVSFDDCVGLWSRYSSASSLYDEVSFSNAHTTVSLASSADFWEVDGVTTTFPSPWPEQISLGTEYITHIEESGTDLYIIQTTPPPGHIFEFGGYSMRPGGSPVTIEHAVDFEDKPYTPHCRTERPTCTANQRCEINGDSVEVFWFPPQTSVSRDMCATKPTDGPVISRPPTNFSKSQSFTTCVYFSDKR
jgi:hypothetical protein